MNPPFPVKAEIVRKRVGELVPRPQEMPTHDPLLGGRLRWHGMCPVMLAYRACGNRPLFPGQGDEGFRAFFRWWDRCDDPVAAVRTVWDME